MTTESAPFEVLIAGGGVAALEAALALHDLSADRVRVRVLAPEDEFVYRPLTVQEPFAYPEAKHQPLAPIVADAGGELVKDALASVDPSARTVRTVSGQEHSYDALLVALGAAVTPRYEHAITVDDRRIDELLHGLIQDVEDGYVKHLAIVIPPRMSWQLPAYELALLTSARAEDMNVELKITLLTPEDAPLTLFGEGASRGVAELLEARGVETITSAYCEIPRGGQIEITPGERTLTADRVIALPELSGPGLAGLPEAEHGFIPVDEHCRVRGLEREYAAGDAVDFAVKHGGLAALQADSAAQAIAAAAGADVQPEEFRPVVHGLLLTGEEPRYLRAEIMGGHGFTSEISDRPQWDPPTKIVARYLAPYLETHGG